MVAYPLKNVFILPYSNIETKGKCGYISGGGGGLAVRTALPDNEMVFRMEITYT
jgi:hypothetical protein